MTTGLGILIALLVLLNLAIVIVLGKVLQEQEKLKEDQELLLEALTNTNTIYKLDREEWHKWRRTISELLDEHHEALLWLTEEDDEDEDYTTH